jgi:hypothetical protein
MKNLVGLGSVGLICVSSFKNTGSGIRKLLGGGGITDGYTRRKVELTFPL